MKGYHRIFRLGVLLLIGILSAGAAAQTRSLIIWSQQEAENTTNNGAIAVSPNGRLVASGRADSNNVDIWNAANGTLIRTLNGVNNNANVLAFSPDSKYLATGTGQPGQGLSLNLWSVDDGVRLVGRIAAFTNGTIGLSFSPDGQFLAAIGFHATGYKIYHVPDMAEVGTFGNFDPELGYNARIFAIAYSRDGQYIAVGATRGIYLRNASDGSLVRIISSNYPTAMTTQSIAFSPNGTDVAAGVTVANANTGPYTCYDCTIKLFRISDGRLLHTYTDPSFVLFPKVAFSPDGRIIGAGFSDLRTSYSGAAQFWNVATEQTIRRDARDFWVQDFAYFPSGRKYAFFGADGVVAVAHAPISWAFGDE
jgi:WD40 repeat protein